VCPLNPARTSIKTKAGNSMYSRTVQFAGFALLAACSNAFAQEWTEAAVLALFDQQSPMRREAQSATAAVVESIRGKTLWPNPIAAYSRETVGFTEFIQIEQRLPISKRLGFERQAMEPARAASEAQGQARIWDARSSLRMAFYRALSAQQQAEVFRAGLTQIDSIIRLLRAREQEGEGSRYDRVRVERETADLRADLALASARARSERAVLAAYLPQQTKLDILTGDLAPRALPNAKDEVVRQSLTSRAEIRAESSRLTQLAFEQQAADRLRIPEPMITAGMKRTQVSNGVFNNRNDTGVVFGVSIPLPTFNKGQTEVARLVAEQSQVQARREVLAQQITAAVAGAFDVYAARLDALSAFDRETRDVGKELLETARVGYEEGELGILQVLDAYRIDRQTNLRRLELQSSVKEIEIELSRNAGYEVTQ
jgi:outer membrane protein, heavy metal efflux system